MSPAYYKIDWHEYLFWCCPDCYSFLDSDKMCLLQVTLHSCFVEEISTFCVHNKHETTGHIALDKICICCGWWMFHVVLPGWSTGTSSRQDVQRNQWRINDRKVPWRSMWVFAPRENKRHVNKYESRPTSCFCAYSFTTQIYLIL